jgi:hypothetical protein
MLDLQVISRSGTALDVVSLAQMKKHLRIDNTKQDDELTAAIEEAVDALDGPLGKLNRSILPCRLVRWLPRFPNTISRPWGVSIYPRRILLPLPPVRSVVSVFYEDTDGTSPMPELSADRYVSRVDGLLGEIELKTNFTWPTVTPNNPRAVGIMYDAGYTVFPPKLQRLVKVLAADFIENKEGTINDRIQAMVSRKTEYGVDFLMTSLRVPSAMDDWECDA